MPDKRAAGAAIAVCAVMTLAACTGTEPGRPSPAGTTTGSDFQGNGANHLTLPPRPRDVPLAGVDPCTLLTTAQRAQIQVRPGVKSSIGHGFTGAGCSFPLSDVLHGGAGQSYGVSAIVSPGVEHWLNPYLTDTVTQVTVAGFPAVTVTPTLAQATGCSTAVSVANGQMLETDTGVTAPNGMTKAQACAKSQEIAQAAMATLLSLK